MIHHYRITKYESRGLGQGSGYLCSCTPQTAGVPYNSSSSPTEREDTVRLTFDEFFDLMTLKITYQRKLMSSQTVYESKAENVTCILWPSFKEQRQHVALSS